jgi:hypothetical protein
VRCTGKYRSRSLIPPGDPYRQLWALSIKRNSPRTVSFFCPSGESMGERDSRPDGADGMICLRQAARLHRQRGQILSSKRKHDMNPDIQLVATERVPIRQIWPSEEQDFTPWLANDLRHLEVLGLGPLSFVGIEVRIPDTDRKLDILAELPDGRRVAIENQYGKADHDHLTRGLAYAAGIQAAALVIVAEQHAPEFVAVADYLNRCAETTEDAFPVFLVTIMVERLAGIDLPYRMPRFEVVTRPNSWRKEVAQGLPPPVTIPEFLETADPTARPTLEAIFDAWERLPNTSIRPRTRSIGLCMAFEHSAGKPILVMSIEPSGLLYVFRKAILGAAPFAERDAEPAFEAAIQRCLPGVKMHEFYLSVKSPTADGVKNFGTWLLDPLAAE